MVHPALRIVVTESENESAFGNSALLWVGYPPKQTRSIRHSAHFFATLQRAATSDGRPDLKAPAGADAATSRGKIVMAPRRSLWPVPFILFPYALMRAPIGGQGPGFEGYATTAQPPLRKFRL